MTDKLRSYGIAHRELLPDVIHDTSQFANNRAEQSHVPTRVRERGNAAFPVSWPGAEIRDRACRWLLHRSCRQCVLWIIPLPQGVQVHGANVSHVLVEGFQAPFAHIDRWQYLNPDSGGPKYKKYKRGVESI